MQQIQEHIGNKRKTFLQLLSFSAIAVGMLALIGWVFNIPSLKSVYHEFPPMRFNATFVVIFLGYSLHLLVTKKRLLLLRSLCIAVATYGIACIYQDISGVQLGIDEFFMKDQDALSFGYRPGRPPVEASICFILLATALFLLSTNKNRMIVVAQYFLNCVTFISFIVTLLYLLSFSFFEFTFFKSLPLNTLTMLFLLSIGVTSLHDDKGIAAIFSGTKTGNMMAKRLFPQILISLILIAFLRGLAYQRNWVTEELGIALIVTSFLILTLFLIWYNANKLNVLDDKRRVIEAEVIVLNRDLKKQIKNIEDYKYAIDASSIVSITDKNGTIQYANENFCKISKYSKEELIGQNHRISNSGYHDKEFFRNLWTTIASGRIWKGEVRNKAKDGTIYWADTTIVPFLDENGMPYQYLAIRSDITEGIKAQEELGAKITELENVNKELESFNFISSHDLQEPLRKIQNFASLLKEEKDLSGEGKYYLEELIGTSSKIRRLIEDLLQYSRIKNTTLNFEKTNINTILKEITDSSKESINKKKAIISIEGECETSIIPFQFRLLFSNLLSNSLKFFQPDRKLKINIKCESQYGAELNPKLAPDIKYCHICITDNGIGFNPKYNERIFNLYERLNGEQFPGTGLGLAICKRIVENHHGLITANGEPDKGAQFDIYIPSDREK